MFCFAHIPKNFFARFARDPPSGGSAFGRVGAEGEEELNIARRAELASRLFSVARLKNPSPCTGDRNQRFRPDFFLRLVDGSLALRQRGKAPEPQAQLGEVDLKVDRTLAFQVTIAIVSSTACPHIIPLMIQIS